MQVAKYLRIMMLVGMISCLAEHLGNDVKLLFSALVILDFITFVTHRIEFLVVVVLVVVVVEVRQEFKILP